MLETALQYLAQGFSVVPIKPGEKYPAIEWRQFQNRLALESEVREWWSVNPHYNIGIITGRISDITVVDFDKKNGGLDTLKTLSMPPTLIVQTGGGGWHYYYRYVQGSVNRANILPGVDIRSDGGLVVAPPSIHPSGAKYEAVFEFNREQISDFPISAIPLDTCSAPKLSADQWSDIFTEPVGRGRRNDTAARLAGLLLSRFERAKWRVAWQIFKLWTEHRCEPPMDQAEAKRTFLSIANLQIRKQEKVLSLKDFDLLPKEQQLAVIENSIKKV